MIRAATLDDLPQLLDLGERMHDESRYRVLAWSRAEASCTLRHLLTTPGGFVWVAERGGRIVGGLAALCAKHWCSTDLVSTDLALFVEPESRGGIAAVRLVEQYRTWARGLGARMVDIGVTTGVKTEETTQLLEHVGFRRCGVVLES